MKKTKIIYLIIFGIITIILILVSAGILEEEEIGINSLSDDELKEYLETKRDSIPESPPNNIDLITIRDGKGINVKSEKVNTTWKCNADMSFEEKADGQGYKVSGEATLSTGLTHDFNCNLTTTGEFLLREETKVEWFYEDGTHYNPEWGIQELEWGMTYWNGEEWITEGKETLAYNDMKVYNVTTTYPVLITNENPDERVINNIKQVVHSFEGIACNKKDNNCNWQLSKDKRSFSIDFQDGDSFSTNSIIPITACGVTGSANNYYQLVGSLVCPNDFFIIGGINITVDGNFSEPDQEWFVYHNTSDVQDVGIKNLGGYDDLTIKDIYLFDFGTCLRLSGTSNSHFEKINCRAGLIQTVLGTQYGVYMSGTSDNNYFNKVYVSGHNGIDGKIDGSYIGMQLDGDNNNMVDSNSLITCDRVCTALWFYGTSGWQINDSRFRASLGPNINRAVYALSSSNNNLLDCEITAGDESGSSFTRQWSYKVQVIDTNGNPVIANISVTNSSGYVEHSITTQADGWLPYKISVTDYILSATKKYYNSVVSAYNSTYGYAFSDYDATIDEKDLTDIIQYNCWFDWRTWLFIPTGCFYHIETGGKLDL